jgi:hypothetical protein
VSQFENTHDDIPRFEPWLAVMICSVVPEIVAAYLPPIFFVPAIVLTVTLFLTGLLMLRRQTARRRLEATRAAADTRPISRSYEPRRLEAEGMAS